MASKRGARRGVAPITALLGAGAVAGVGGAALLRRFDQWALASITQPARRQAAGVPSDFGLPYEEIRLRSDDEVDLYGWLIPAPGGLPAARGTIILGHGFGDTIDAILGHAVYLQRAGHNILLVDFRAHGRSGGDRTSMGYLEHQDIGASLRYLADRDLRRVGVMGWSLGGAISMVSGALYPEIAGVISDSGFARLASPLSRAVVVTLRRPPWLGRIAGWYGERLVARSLGFNAADARPLSYIGRISPRPLLIIHSAEDDLVPVADARALYAAAGEPKELWITHAGGHVPGTYGVFPEEYQRRVLDFWERAFATDLGAA